MIKKTKYVFFFTLLAYSIYSSATTHSERNSSTNKPTTIPITYNKREEEAAKKGLIRNRLMATGSFEELEDSIIEYNTEIRLGEENEVRVKLSKELIDAKIYVKITNTCGNNGNSLCGGSNYNDIEYNGDLLGPSITYPLTPDGPLVYKGSYKVRSKAAGYFTLSFYVERPGLVRHCYDNSINGGPKNKIRKGVDQIISFNWGEGVVCLGLVDHVCIIWRGKLITHSSGYHHFDALFDDTFRLLINGEEVSVC